MDDKKYRPFKLAHLILMALTIVITLAGMVNMTRRLGGGIDGLLTLRLVSSAIRIFAMSVGILYLVSGYKKNSAGYYKLFFWLMVICLVLRLMVLYTNNVNTLMLIGGAATIVLAFVLMAGKDMGRSVSYALLAALVIIEILLKLPFSFSNLSIGKLGGEFSMFMLFGTAGFMITAKYIDKSLRGSK